jgi:putative transposase
MRMLLSLQIQLVTNEQETELLLETMKRCNLAANFIAQKAFGLKLANKYELQKLFYKEIRERFNLGAQFAIRVISKAVEAYKRDTSRQPRFRPNEAIQYDQRNLSWKGIDSVSLSTLKGRIKLRTSVGEYQRTRAMSGLRGQGAYCSASFFGSYNLPAFRREKLKLDSG